MPIASDEPMGWLRAAVGLALIAAPGVPMRISGREEPTGASAAALALAFVGGDLQSRRRREPDA